MEGSQTETLPKHVAIIMDGNNRWASEKNLPGVAGHKKGVERARESVEYAVQRGLSTLTLFAFISAKFLEIISGDAPSFNKLSLIGPSSTFDGCAMHLMPLSFNIDSLTLLFDARIRIIISIFYFMLGVAVFYISYAGAKIRGTLINIGE